MLRWPWLGIGVGSIADSGGGTPAPPVDPTAVVRTGDAQPIVPQLQYPPITARGTGEIVKVFNDFARKASLASNENPGWVQRKKELILPLSTSGATTDTDADFLPANSRLSHLTTLVTTAITTAATFEVGTAADPDRFSASAAGIALGSARVCLRHHTLATDIQEAAGALRITCNATPGAGRLKLVLWYEQFLLPSLNASDPSGGSAPPTPSATNGGLRWPLRWLG